MPIYTYNAVDEKGERQQGEVEAASREEFIGYLDNKGLVLISLSERGEFSSASKTSIFDGSLSLFDRYILFEDLGTMVNAGLPINNAIKILIEDAEKPVLKKILADFQFTLEKGNPLSSALEHHPNFFSPVVINLVKAGEASGNLERTLKTIAKQFKKDNALKDKMVSAMIYPAILMALSVVVIIFMFIFVIPKLSVFFKQANIALPLFTQIIVGIGEAFSKSYALDALIFALLVSLFIFISKTVAGKSMVVGFVSHFPLTKKLFRTLSIYRYCWTMGVLISSGVGILESIDITQNILSGKLYKQSLLRIKEAVSKGISLGNAMKNEKGLYPNIVSGMTNVGEQTGNLEKIYITLAKFYERNFSTALKQLVTIIEPLLLLTMGLVIGGIAIAVILPIYKFVSGVH